MEPAQKRARLSHEVPSSNPRLCPRPSLDPLCSLYSFRRSYMFQIFRSWLSPGTFILTNIYNIIRPFPRLNYALYCRQMLVADKSSFVEVPSSHGTLEPDHRPLQIDAAHEHSHHHQMLSTTRCSSAKLLAPVAEDTSYLTAPSEAHEPHVLPYERPHDLIILSCLICFCCRGIKVLFPPSGESEVAECLSHVAWDELDPASPEHLPFTVPGALWSLIFVIPSH